MSEASKLLISSDDDVIREMQAPIADTDTNTAAAADGATEVAEIATVAENVELAATSDAVADVNVVIPVEATSDETTAKVTVVADDNAATSQDVSMSEVKA